MPSQFSVCACAGSSSSDWSRTSTTSFSTQMVMTSGIQISRPVMKYFFMVPETKRPGARRAASQSRRESVGHRRSGGFLGLGLRLALRVGLGLGLGVGFQVGLLLRRLFARALE